MSRQGSPKKATPPSSTVDSHGQHSFGSVQSSSKNDDFTLTVQLTRGLEDCNWEELQDRYMEAMDEHSHAEDNLRAETAKLLEIFSTWSQTTIIQDEKRALKRFKTQMQHVQNSEVGLESKKKHYADVVKAFQSALALLNEQMRV